jgi:methylated-DNA-[protein]-cysteine S-methyltransferase
LRIAVHSIAFFDTAIGTCGLAWTDRGVSNVHLPGTRNPDRSLQGLPPQIGSVIGRIQSLLAGEAVDFSDVQLDIGDVPKFHRAVYQATGAIPFARTRTYGEIAHEIGHPNGAQAVGKALGATPVPIVVPCHRVVGAGGRMVGFSAPGGVEMKRRLLVVEGAIPDALMLF